MKYIAEVFNVREVALVSSTDPAIWDAELRRIGLFPYAPDGRVEVIISATSAQWRGKRFREMAVAVSVCRQERGDRVDGYYLACAFHSSRLFGWIERTMFKTPYYAATVEIDDQSPVSIASSISGTLQVGVAMGEARAQSDEVEDDSEVAVFLPPRNPRPSRKRNIMHARLAGTTNVFPFLAAGDAITINPATDYAALRRLADGGIEGREWRVRHNATHARSKTFAEKLSG